MKTPFFDCVLMNRNLPTHGGRRRRTALAGFTLIELLVVLGVLVLLIGLLLPALSAVRSQARKAETDTLIKSVADAAEAFQLDHFRYPGHLTERQLNVLGVADKWSGTENALLDLMGGLQDPGGSQSDSFDFWGEDIFRASIGTGPVIRGTRHEAYFTPKPKDLYYVNGQLGQEDVDDNLPDKDASAFPDLVDSWGMPILFWRDSGEQPDRQGNKTILARRNSKPDESASYYWASFQSYTNAEALEVARSGTAINQQDRSLLSWNGPGSSDIEELCNTIVEHPTLTGVPHGKFIIISAGPDNVYFDVDQFENGDPGEFDDLNKFDDMIRWFGG